MQSDTETAIDTEEFYMKDRKLKCCVLGLILGIVSIALGFVDSAPPWLLNPMPGYGLMMVSGGIAMVVGCLLVATDHALLGGSFILIGGIVSGPFVFLMIIPEISSAVSIYLSLGLGWILPILCFKYAYESQREPPTRIMYPPV